jgi:hypothetical protein
MIPANPPPPPQLLGFTPITDNPRAGEVPPGCSTQTTAGPVNIPVSFWSWTVWNAGDGISVGPALSLFVSEQLVLPHSGQVPKIIVLYYTPSKYTGVGTVCLDLVNTRSKTEQNHVLDSPTGPQFN